MARKFWSFDLWVRVIITVLCFCFYFLRDPCKLSRLGWNRWLTHNWRKKSLVISNEKRTGSFYFFTFIVLTFMAQVYAISTLALAFCMAQGILCKHFITLMLIFKIWNRARVLKILWFFLTLPISFSYYVSFLVNPQEHPFYFVQPLPHASHSNYFWDYLVSIPWL